MATVMTSAQEMRPTPGLIWTDEPWIDDTVMVEDDAASLNIVPNTTANDMSDVDKLVAAFVRVRGLNRLDGGIISRCWLAHDMDMPAAELDSLLSLLRWQGLVRLPNADLVAVDDAPAMRDIALSCPPLPSVVVPLHRKTAA